MRSDVAAYTAENSWFRLDNAAKIYPARQNSKNSCVYRIAVNLMSDVDPATLQQAVSDCKPRFPTMYIKLKRGLFWNYYEVNEELPVVKAEPPVINQYIDAHTNHGYYFTVFYYRNRISLEAFHGLGDGSGGMEFMKAIVYRYLELQGCELNPEGSVLTVDQAPTHAEMEDSFAKYYKPHEYGARGRFTRRGGDVPSGESRTMKAYHIRGTRLFPEGGIGVINGKIPTVALLDLAKKNGASLTQYLAAVLAHSILATEDYKLFPKLPINICVPVNMRRVFPSRTLRNFSLFFHTSVSHKHRDMGVEGILEQVKSDFISALTTEKLQRNMNQNVSAEKNIALRLCPLFLKLILLRIGSALLGDTLSTCTISNLGNIPLPPSMSRWIEGMEVNMSAGAHSSHNIGVVSCNGWTTISFSRAIYETEIERSFFSYLAAQGVPVEIQSNLRERYA